MYFFFQAEDGIRDRDVTGVQTCALPISFDKAMAVKQAFMREKERKTQEALTAIADYRRAQWQKKVADAMEQFEVAGISETRSEERRVGKERSVGGARKLSRER